MQLINKILHIIEENNIQNFLLNETITHTEELFFVKKDLTLTRNKDITKCDVTIYHDFEKDGMKMRGSSSFLADNTMSEHTLIDKVKAAYSSALSVCNPYYKLPSSNEMFTESDKTNHTNITSAKNYTGLELSRIIYKNDIYSEAFINSMELFVTQTEVHIVNSNGINVSYTDKRYSGEFIVQCKEPNDVELYQSFEYSSEDMDIEQSIANKFSKSLQMIKDRANAVSVHDIPAADFCYDTIILDGSCVYELFNYYLRRLDASMIFPGYSQFKLKEPVIASQSASADKLNITLSPKIPYSSEGIKLMSANLVKDNIPQYITGNARFSFYLGIPAIGEYNSFHMKCGKTSLAEMCKTPYLRIVNFSDFQMDELAGQFGGEFRLAYYFDGIKTIPVTNGSISGNINNLVKTMHLSQEEQCMYNFNGPQAVSYMV